MAYSKQNFQDGQILTAANLKKMENGIIAGQGARNLLDNSNFADLVAQAGLNGAHGSTAYIADRWKSGNATATANSGYTTISSTVKAGRIVQMLPAAVAGKTVTAAAKVASANTIYFGVYYIQNSVSKYINNSFTSPNGVIMVTGAIPADATNIEFRIYTSYIDGGGSCNVYWAALYEGSYTADTLPAYQPKGYAAELAECQRYYYQSWDGSKFNKGYITREAISASSLALIEFPTEMRIVPTITFYTAANETGVVKEWTTSSSVSATQNYTSTKAFGVSGGSNFTIGKTYFFHYTASADL